MGEVQAAAQSYDKARDQLARVWEDQRAMRMRAEVLHPLAEELDTQVRAGQQWHRHREAAGTCVVVMGERLDEARKHMMQCAEEEQQASDRLLDAANAVEAGMRHVETCVDRCERALRELEAAVPCGGKVPVSHEVWAEISWLVVRAGVRAAVVVRGKEMASDLITDGVGQVLGADAPPYDQEVSDQVLDRLVDVGEVTVAKARSWWRRRGGGR